MRFDPSVLPQEASIQEIYGALAADTGRLDLILADIRRLIAEGRAPVVLTERRAHLDLIAEPLREEMPNLVVLHGGVKPKARRAALAQLAEQADSEPRLILATGRYLGEGFDDPRLDTLLLTMPIAWKGTVVQYAGRLHRATPASETSESTTTSTARFPCSGACTRSASAPIRRWATSAMSQRKNSASQFD
jgi:superfamily II DNA or RNA helicase